VNQCDALWVVTAVVTLMSRARKIALAGGFWMAGESTCRIPVVDPDHPDGGRWVDVPLTTCSECHLIAPANPCLDCQINAGQGDHKMICDICGRGYIGASHMRTCSQTCSTLKSNTHNTHFTHPHGGIHDGFTHSNREGEQLGSDSSP